MVFILLLIGETGLFLPVVGDDVKRKALKKTQ